MSVLRVTKLESSGERRNMSYERMTEEQTKNVEMLKERSVPSGKYLNGEKGDLEWGWEMMPGWTVVQAVVFDARPRPWRSLSTRWTLEVANAVVLTRSRMGRQGGLEGRMNSVSVVRVAWWCIDRE